MHWKEPYIRDALRKYELQERNLQDEIFECESKRLQIEYERGNKTFLHKSTIVLTNNEEARVRNQNFLKDLEESKARLRTTASFTPTDRELDERSFIYKRSLAIKSCDEVARRIDLSDQSSPQNQRKFDEALFQHICRQPFPLPKNS